MRRSSREPEDSNQPFYRSPYRCRDCRTKFWAFSGKLYRRIVVAGVVVSIVLVLMLALIISAEFGAPGFGMEPMVARVAANLPPRWVSGGGCEIHSVGRRAAISEKLPPKLPSRLGGF